MISRRALLSTAAAGLPAIGLAACASTTTNGVTTYGFSQQVITYITDAVQAVANYAPSIESIAATAAGLFGPAYAAAVTIGSTAINTLISTLQSIIPTLPVGGKLRSGAIISSASGSLAGYAKLPNGTYIPVFAQ